MLACHIAKHQKVDFQSVCVLCLIALQYQLFKLLGRNSNRWYLPVFCVWYSANLGENQQNPPESSWWVNNPMCQSEKKLLQSQFNSYFNDLTELRGQLGIWNWCQVRIVWRSVWWEPSNREGTAWQRGFGEFCAPKCSLFFASEWCTCTAAEMCPRSWENIAIML